MKVKSATHPVNFGCTLSVFEEACVLWHSVDSDRCLEHLSVEVSVMDMFCEVSQVLSVPHHTENQIQ